MNKITLDAAKEIIAGAEEAKKLEFLWLFQ